tara:strand:- start:576 stop:857 length:282 start_codon:yes stop_codon:yes gene_type:complete
METPAEFYTKRNAELLRQWLKLTRGGMDIRTAAETVANNNKGITKGLVNGIVYNKKYPYGPEAWEIIHKEEEAAEKLKKEKPRTATTGVVATA